MARKRGPLSAAHKAAISASLRGRAANSISASMKKRSSATVSRASAGGFRGAKGRINRPSKVQANRRGRRAASLVASGRSKQTKLNPKVGSARNYNEYSFRRQTARAKGQKIIAAGIGKRLDVMTKFYNTHASTFGRKKARKATIQ